MITYEEIRNNSDIRTYVKEADTALAALGFTEHSFAHVTKVATVAGTILKELGYSESEQELAKVAGYLHDIGNVVNRIDHAQSGAVMAFRMLDRMDVDPEDVATIVTAIGNHDESTAFPVNAVAAALILADKTDVRRSRVRNQAISTFDIHDRVNYSVIESNVSVNRSEIKLDITIETKICSVMEYFEIFLNRMLLCRKAAEKLRVNFALVINGQKMM